MPSYRLKLYFCPAANGQPVRSTALPIWWSQSAFYEKFGSRQVEKVGLVYVDYGFLLTGQPVPGGVQIRED